jgi:hypothetical protein
MFVYLEGAMYALQRTHGRYVLMSDLRTLPLSAAHYGVGRDWSKRVHVTGATIAPRIWTVMYQNIDPPQNPLKVR